MIFALNLHVFNSLYILKHDTFKDLSLHLTYVAVVAAINDFLLKLWSIIHLFNFNFIFERLNLILQSYQCQIKLFEISDFGNVFQYLNFKRG